MTHMGGVGSGRQLQAGAAQVFVVQRHDVAASLVPPVEKPQFFAQKRGLLATNGVIHTEAVLRLAGL